MEAKTLIDQIEKRTELNRLIDRLLAEPFSVSQKIEDASLESIQRSFEEIDEAFAEGSPPDEIVDAQDSYERAKELFCLVLLELEAIGARGGETLHEIRHQEAGTQLIAPRVETSRSHPATPLSIVPTAPEPPEDIFASLEGEEIHWSNEASPPEAPDLPSPEQAANPTPLTELASPEELAAVPTSDEGILPFPFEKEEREAKAEEPQARVAPPAPPPAVETVLEKIPSGPRDPKAVEFVGWAKKFRESPAWSAGGRFEAQCLLFAVECELWSRLRPAAQAFWAKKEGAIRELLDTGNKRFDFHPILKKGLDALASEKGEWLPGGTLPMASVLNSVRFLTSAPEWQSFWPLPVELGMLLLFFGGERAMRGLILRNHLEVRGIDADESVEAAFRLFRCQKSRNRALSPAGSELGIETLREDCERLLELAAKLEAGRSDRG